MALGTFDESSNRMIASEVKMWQYFNILQYLSICSCTIHNSLYNL